MRIISGIYGRRKLEVPKGRDIRPTSDKIRGAIFNALESHGAIQNARVLDAFSGTGALGLEALSRGAAHCTFLDKAKTSLELTKRNINMLDACTGSTAILSDATKHKFVDKTYNLFFLDPPYHKDLIGLTLNNILSQHALDKSAILVCESEREVQPVQGDAFESLSDKIYGEIRIQILRYNANTRE